MSKLLCLSESTNINIENPNPNNGPMTVFRASSVNEAIHYFINHKVDTVLIDEKLKDKNFTAFYRLIQCLNPLARIEKFNSDEKLKVSTSETDEALFAMAK